MTRKQLENNCVELVTVNGRPFNRSFLGVNIQYIKGTKIILRTLALKELQEKHTGEYIKTILKNVCFSFNISLDQIYSITTDNGANMLKAVRILTYEDEDCDNNILEENENNIDYNSEENEANEYEIDNLSVFENINVIEDLTSNNETSILSLTGIRCAAHTLQLAVDDALKRAKSISQLILKARNLAKKLRTQTFIYLIRKQNLKKPTLDCPTQWCSIIDMLENLLLLQDYCEELSVTKFQNFVTLKDDEWSKIEEICAALRPSKICTKRLQEEQLTLSEFFGFWFETKVATEALQTPFSKLIVEQMFIWILDIKYY
ncbi:PREDICTED: uncharacterized protein LOC108769763 [Trachymyrmex cornetzi]|uniref:uncharacterized protein LOC108769763 n=1 Tax=Trachymyrmex cornetzi TaxID=471704 RepID=UPI00084F0392|nr:PREDICTED: uncharacterized protein LOC108769763 [Trachymyrmex cornetzi]